MKQRTKKLFAWLMTFAMLLSLLPAAGLTALAEGEVTYRVPTYVDNDPAKGISGWETKSTNQYTTITNQTTWNAGWYVVEGFVTITSTVTVNGDVNLILKDGCKLTVEGDSVEKGIDIREGGSLTIYGQTNGTGALVATGVSSGKAYGIYGNSTSSITINGGTVKAIGTSTSTSTSSKSGGYGIDNSSITINGGAVTAAGTGSSANYGICGTRSITINGGTVKANATVSVFGNGYGIYSNSSITINGGTVTANGTGISSDSTRASHGIYSHSSSATCSITITINGGTVTATGSGCATSSGICSNTRSGASSITINGGTVTATGTDSGIYSNAHSGGNSSITIDGGTVQAKGGTAAVRVEDSEKGTLTIDGKLTIAGATETYVAGETKSLTNKAEAEYVTIQLLPVSYLSPVYNTPDTPTSGLQKMEPETCAAADYTLVTASDSAWGGTANTDTWYVVSGTVEIKNTVTCTGNVNLILKDGCKLTVTDEGTEEDDAIGIAISEGGSLTIYGQSKETGELKVTATGYSSGYGYGYGIYSESTNGTSSITINGGKITANATVSGSGNGFGIYSSSYSDTSNITINGGTVTTNGSVSGSSGFGYGIYSSSYSDTSSITINGGTVQAKGGTKAVSVKDSDTGTLTIDASLRITGADENYEKGTTRSLTNKAGAEYVTIQPSVSYLSPVYNTPDTPTSGLQKMKPETCAAADYTLVTASTTTWDTANTDTWYVVSGTVEIKNTVTCTGNVNLILKDGCKLTVGGDSVDKGIVISEGGSLTIYGQTNGTGALVATGTGSVDSKGCSYGYGIYSKSGESATSSITINGGTVTANGTGTGDGDGYGYGYGIYSEIGESATSSITINGGTVTASGSGIGSGIGTYGNGTSSITINGGTVQAKGGTKAVGVMNSNGTLTIDGKLTITGANETYVAGETKSLTNKGEEYVTIAHIHVFTYTADGTALTATCSADGCPLTDSKVSLTLTAPTLTTYGGTGSAEATLSETETTAWTGAGLTVPAIEYYNGTEKLSAAPTGAGTYTAKITVNTDKIASVEYTIDKADQTRTASAPTLANTTETVITINPVMVADETVEYAKNTTNSAPEGGWQTGTEFTGLRADTTYYIFARVQESTNYKAGPASEALEAKTAAASSGDRSGGGGSSSTHRASVTTPTNGTVKLDKTYATRGSTVTITVTPNEGYVVDTVTVKDANGNTIETTKTSDTTYTFTMPNSKVTVSATFKAEKEETTTPVTQPTTLPFADVKSGDWFHDSIAYVCEKNLMNGVSNTEFAPNDTTTRAMVVTILWRMAGSPVVDYAMSSSDVPADQWYTEAVRWAASTGVVKGISDTEFGPDVAVTREALATMVYRYEQNLGNGFTGTWMFLLPQSDTDQVSEWADEAMHWCVMKGVINGDDQNNLNPQKNATRAEIATIFKNLDAVEP